MFEKGGGLMCLIPSRKEGRDGSPPPTGNKEVEKPRFYIHMKKIT